MKELKQWKPRQPGNTGTQLSNHSKYWIAKTPGKEDSDLKLYLMTVMKIFEKCVNNSLKQVQKNTQKQIEAFKEETQKSLK